MRKEDKIGCEAFQWARAKAVNSNKTSLLGLLLLAAPPFLICLCTVLRYLARIEVMTPVEVVLERKMLLGVVHAGADGQALYLGCSKHFQRGGVVSSLWAVVLMMAV